jgi:hypothetical protein
MHRSHGLRKLWKISFLPEKVLIEWCPSSCVQSVTQTHTAPSETTLRSFVSTLRVLISVDHDQSFSTNSKHQGKMLLLIVWDAISATVSLQWDAISATVSLQYISQYLTDLTNSNVLSRFWGSVEKAWWSSIETCGVRKRLKTVVLDGIVRICIPKNILNSEGTP